MNLTAAGSKLTGIIRYERYKVLCAIIVPVCSFLLAVCAERVYSVGRTYIFGTVRAFLSGSGPLDIFPDFSMMTVYRTAFLFCILFFLLIHLIVKIPVSLKH